MLLWRNRRRDCGRCRDVSQPASSSSCEQGVAKIGDYAIVGDCRSAALVSRQGSLDWLCLPHFSSPAVFGALLDGERGGRFLLGPGVPAQATRRYLPGTNVLETTFRTHEGSVRVLDCMSIPSETGLQPGCEVLRLAEGIEGAVPVRIEIDLQPDYGRKAARLQRRGPTLWTWAWGDECVHLACNADLQPRDNRLLGERVLAVGQRLSCSLTHVKKDVGVVLGLERAAQQRFDDTVNWWLQWSGRARYQGPYREAVLRSALTLKLLTFALSGAVVAAPSTSLPETLGGDRNWDYRYCWLRDAALTMRAFVGLGYLEEARAFFDWLLHATRLTWPELLVLYDVYGRSRLPERELRHWRGFCNSRPVRIGNGAYVQRQLDVYGAVCDAARQFAGAVGRLERDEARLLQGFGEAVCHLWRQPDHGIWEIRGVPRHYTFSKLMCWTALDALLALAAKGMLKAPAKYQAAHSALREAIETRGYSRAIDSYVSVLGGTHVDASLLLMGCLGYADPREERMRATFSRIEERLSRNGLLLRYEREQDGMAGTEGAFGICSFWAIDNLAKRGDRPAARRQFDHVLSFANDLGLFAEQIDPDSGAQLGNFPQAYTHVGLINAALALEGERN
jgi:GH15 family glucan-1,4-alpha-glucosidase